MQTSTGQVLFAVPKLMPESRIDKDRKRYTKLLNDKFLATSNYSQFQSFMTSEGVRDWLLVGHEGKTDCELKILLFYFGKQCDKCGCCFFCCLTFITNVQENTERLIQRERENGQATELVLRKLLLVCLACGRENCHGIPILKGKRSFFLPENRGCCFSWNLCYQCGVSVHD